jgi:thioesterase domain-containing protein/acyl carrier protein
MGETVGRGPLGPDDDFFSVGGDSLSSIRLSIELERWFRRPVVPADLLEGRTPRALARVMQNRLDREAETPVLELRAGRPGLEQEAPLVLVPGLGGSPLSFVTLVRLLGGGRRVLGATLPDGRLAEDEEISIESIARRVVDALPGVPCVHFIGYSMGARIAFEAARQVIAQGRGATLIVLDTMALADGAGPRRWARTAWRAARRRLRFATDPSRAGEATAEPAGGPRARNRRSATLLRTAAERHSYERAATPMALLVSTSTTGRRWSAADGGWSRVANLLMQEAIPGNHLSIVAGDAIGTTAQAIDRAITMLERASQASPPLDT